MSTATARSRASTRAPFYAHVACRACVAEVAVLAGVDEALKLLGGWAATGDRSDTTPSGTS